MSACQSLAAEDAPATLQMEMTAYATEVAVLRDEMQIQRTSVSAMVQAVETQSAEIYRFNSVLLATVQSGVAPTPSGRLVVQGEGAMSDEMLDTSDGVMRFMQIGTASTILPEDGCFERHVNYFRVDQTDRVYLTGLAVNLQAGTRLVVDWFYQGEQVHQSTWTAPEFAETRCIALELNRDHTAFQPGSWSATLYINGEAREPVTFVLQ